jgi:hypothetical protein
VKDRQKEERQKGRHKKGRKEGRKRKKFAFVPESNFSAAATAMLLKQLASQTTSKMKKMTHK